MQRERGWRICVAPGNVRRRCAEPPGWSRFGKAHLALHILGNVLRPSFDEFQCNLLVGLVVKSKQHKAVCASVQVADLQETRTLSSKPMRAPGGHAQLRIPRPLQLSSSTIARRIGCRRSFTCLAVPWMALQQVPWRPRLARSVGGVNLNGCARQPSHGTSHGARRIKSNDAGFQSWQRTHTAVPTHTHAAVLLVSLGLRLFRLHVSAVFCAHRGAGGARLRPFDHTAARPASSDGLQVDRTRWVTMRDGSIH